VGQHHARGRYKANTATSLLCKWHSMCSLLCTPPANPGLHRTAIEAINLRINIMAPSPGPQRLIVEGGRHGKHRLQRQAVVFTVGHVHHVLSLLQVVGQGKC